MSVSDGDLLLPAEENDAKSAAESGASRREHTRDLEHGAAAARVVVRAGSVAGGRRVGALCGVFVLRMIWAPRRCQESSI